HADGLAQQGPHAMHALDEGGRADLSRFGATNDLAQQFVFFAPVWHDRQKPGGVLLSPRARAKQPIVVPAMRGGGPRPELLRLRASFRGRWLDGARQAVAV